MKNSDYDGLEQQKAKQSYVLNIEAATWWVPTTQDTHELTHYGDFWLVVEIVKGWGGWCLSKWDRSQSVGTGIVTGSGEGGRFLIKLSSLAKQAKWQKIIFRIQCWWDKSTWSNNPVTIQRTNLYQLFWRSFPSVTLLKRSMGKNSKWSILNMCTQNIGEWGMVRGCNRVRVAVVQWGAGSVMDQWQADIFEWQHG